MSVVRRMLRTNLVRHGSNRTKAVSFTPFGRHFMTTVTLENQTQPNWVDDFEKEMRYYNQMSLCMNAQRPSRALELYRLMLKRGLRPSERIANIAIASCAVLRESENAATILHVDMPRYNLIPTEESFYHLFKALSHGADLAAVDRGVALVDDLGITLSESLSGAIFDAFSRLGAFKQSEAWYESIKKKGIPISALKTAHLIESLGGADRASDCVDIIRNMMHEGLTPCSSAVSFTIWALSDQRKTRQAALFLDLLRTKLDLRLDSRMFHGIFNRWAMEWNITAIQKQMQLIESGMCAISPWTYVVLTKLYARSFGRFDLAADCFRKITSLPDSNHLRNQALGNILNACARHSRFDEAIRILEVSCALGIVPPQNSLNQARLCNILSVVAESGDFKSANLILQMMESMGSPPSTSTYIALIEGYNTWGMPKEALGVFQSMLKQGITVDDTTFAFLLKGCIQVGAAPVVERLWQEFVERRGIRAGRYSWHFRIQALASFDMVAALNLALDLLSDQRPDRMEIISLAMFTHIITAYFKAGAISLQQSESYLKWLRIARSPITPQTRRRQGWIYKRLGEILPPNPGVIDDLREMLEYCVEGHREMPATTPQAEVTVEPQPQGS